MAVESTNGAGVNDAGSRTVRQPDPRDGILGSILALSLGMVESSVRTSAHLARTLTSESQRVTEAVILLNEQTSQALLRTVRKLNEAGFGLATDLVNRLEHGALVMISHGQKTSDRVAELAAQTSQAAVGSRGIHSGVQA